MLNMLLSKFYMENILYGAVVEAHVGWFTNCILNRRKVSAVLHVHAGLKELNAKF